MVAVQMLAELEEVKDYSIRSKYLVTLVLKNIETAYRQIRLQ